MRKIILLISAMCLFNLYSNDSKAQGGFIKIMCHDSLWSQCSMPATVDFYLLFAGVDSTAAVDSITLYIDYGDRHDFTRKIPFGLAAKMPFNFSDRITHIYTSAGTFSAKIVVSAPSGLADSITYPSFTLSDSCATISGDLYIDANGNCVKDVGEQAVFNAPILVANASDTIVSGYSDKNGHYTCGLHPGAYTIIPNYYPKWPLGTGISQANLSVSPACPSSGTYTFTAAPTGSYSADFGYTCTPATSYDAQIISSACGFTPGDSSRINIWGGDWSMFYPYVCTGLSTTVTLTLDSRLTYKSVAYGMTPSSVSGSTITYTLSSTADLFRFYSSIWAELSTTASLGDTLTITAYISPTSLSDPKLSNNTYVLKKIVTASYDPNMKEAAPQGEGPEGFVEANTPMSYTIHFQNTGTAKAKNVLISDKIDTDLDINSIHLLGSTHDVNMYVDGDLIRFNFEDINLPDSTTDYNGSMGSVTYAIAMKKDLSPGTEISNKAEIYFDYNAPIITNSTLNTIAHPTSIKAISKGEMLAQIYPNPANTRLVINNLSSDAIHAQLINVVGQEVWRENAISGTKVINTTTLANGIYIMTLKDKQGNTSQTKIVISH